MIREATLHKMRANPTVQATNDEQEGSDDDRSASSEGSYESQHSSGADEFNDSE